MKDTQSSSEDVLMRMEKGLLLTWGRILRGHVPLLSIEITRECPLHCPGCYAYNDEHLAGGVLLRQLNDKRGDDLVAGVLGLVDHHKPVHVTLVGGEPLVRHRELSRILPELRKRRVHTMVVTSAVIPIPEDWKDIPDTTVCVSVDGLPEHHDVRRAPATYDKVLTNIAAGKRKVNVHCTVTRPMMQRPGYMEEYVRFWQAHPLTNRIWVSVYTPQKGERSAEILSPGERDALLDELPLLAERYPKVLGYKGLAEAYRNPPKDPSHCTFARLSNNYSADLKTRVDPCIFGGNPDCSQCGCVVSGAAEYITTIAPLPPVKPLKLKHFVGTSLAVGKTVNRVVPIKEQPKRWKAA